MDCKDRDQILIEEKKLSVIRILILCDCMITLLLPAKMNCTAKVLDGVKMHNFLSFHYGAFCASVK